jgi:hypothetical protein
MKKFFIISTIFSIVHLGYSQNVSDLPVVKTGDFDGMYFEVNVGSQNVFGGSFVNDMDILAQESKLVTEIGLGYRKQFMNNRLVTGLAFSLGFLNGNLEHISADDPLKINYKNSSQYSFGLITGILLDKHRRFLLYGYLNETKRKFHVIIDQPPYNYTQRDKQGMLKFGVGMEYQVFKRFHVKASFGGLRVDFGELKTNINVEDKYDLMTGIVYQF